MTITLRDNQLGGSTTTSVNIAVTTAVNDYLFAFIHIDSHTAGVTRTVTGVTDTQGNTWSKLASQASTQVGAFENCELWGAVNLSGTTVTATATISGSNNASSLSLSSYGGVDPVHPVDVAFTFQTNFTETSVVLTNNCTPVTAGSVVITGAFSSEATPSLSSTTGWTDLAGPISSGTLSTLRNYHSIQTAIAAITATWTAQNRYGSFIGALRPAFTLGAHASGNTLTAGATSLTVSVTTTQPNDIIVAVFQSINGANSATYSGISSLTSTGLTWHQRSIKQHDYTNGGSHFPYDTEVWWTVVPTPGSVSAVASFPALASTGSQQASMALLVISGAPGSTSNPWDSNASFPAYSNTADTTINSVLSPPSVSTSASQSILISAEFDGGGGTVAVAVGSGMTSIQALASTFDAFVEAKKVTASGAQTTPWTGTRNVWTIMTDAISGDTPVVVANAQQPVVVFM